LLTGVTRHRESARRPASLRSRHERRRQSGCDAVAARGLVGQPPDFPNSDEADYGAECSQGKHWRPDWTIGKDSGNGCSRLSGGDRHMSRRDAATPAGSVGKRGQDVLSAACSNESGNGDSQVRRGARGGIRTLTPFRAPDPQVAAARHGSPPHVVLCRLVSSCASRCRPVVSKP